LIATDVASRGIDVTDVSCVIHFDPPDDGKVYKHRSGRTARAGSTGTVVCLVLKSQIRKYKRIQHEVGIKCRFIEPNFDRLEGREFIEAPPLKYDDDEKKPRGRRNSRDNKRSRRYKKSNGYKSQKSDDKKGDGHHKKKNHHRQNKGKIKKKVTYKDKRNNKAKFNRR
jgi:superfamily II DNA/RNA helicase